MVVGPIGVLLLVMVVVVVELFVGLRLPNCTPVAVGASGRLVLLLERQHWLVLWGQGGTLLRVVGLGFGRLCHPIRSDL